MRNAFRWLAELTEAAVGSPWAFLAALVVLVVWTATGIWFGFSEWWHLWGNTATSIVTFLIVFLIQNTQKRYARALHLKLNELLRAVEGAHAHLINLEELSDEEMDRLEQAFRRHREQQRGGGAPGIQEVVQNLEAAIEKRDVPPK